MGYFALGIRDTIHAIEGSQMSIYCGFFSWPSSFRILQTLWWSPRWNRWSLYNPCNLRRTNLAAIIWRHIKKGPRGNIIIGVGVVLVSPHNYVIPRAFSLIERASIMWWNTMLCWLECNLQIKSESRTLKLMLTPNSSATNARRVRSATWGLNTLP